MTAATGAFRKFDHPTKTIYVKGFELYTNLADGQMYVEVVHQDHIQATPIQVPLSFQARLIHGKPYMLCLDRFGSVC